MCRLARLISPGSGYLKNGEEELWEGVFIDRNDNGNAEFGLGIKLGKPISLTEGLKIERIFFKKVSP